MDNIKQQIESKKLDNIVVFTLNLADIKLVFDKFVFGDKYAYPVSLENRLAKSDDAFVLCY